MSTELEQREPLWTSLKRAVRGTHHDYTGGPVGQSLILLAVPMILETLMESLFAVVDVFFVAKLGADAVATVGITESMLFIVYSVALGLSIGATATVARRIGEQDEEGAAVAAVQCIGLGLFVAALLGVFGVWAAPWLLEVMGGSASVVKEGTTFTRIMLGGSFSVMMLFLINAIFRGAGDAVIAMRVLWFANFINILLGPCLIFGLGPFPEMGVAGAATATTIGRTCGVLYQLRELTRTGGRIRICRRHLKLDADVMLRIWKLSATGIFQILVGTASWIGIVRILSAFGSTALAGNTIGIRIIMFALLPSWGMSNAAATLVGQALGAGKPERAERAAWLAGFYNMVFLGTVGLVFIALPHQIVGVFTSDPAVAAYGAECLRTVAYGFVFYAYGMVLTSALNGAGDTWSPTWINLACYWVIELPGAYILAHYAGFGPAGVFWAVAVSFSMLAVISAIVFRNGAWKRRRV